MKLSENQKDIFYIALTVFLAVGLGIVVFLIVKHLRNKNSNNCTPNCNGKNCGDDGCKGNCGGCQSGQTCGEDGKCSGGSTCPTNCNGINCGEGCSACPNSCPSDKPCTQGQCTDGPAENCYKNNEDPFGGKKCQKDGCCNESQYLCFHPKHEGGKDNYTCQTEKCKNNTPPPKCSTLPNECENKNLCTPDTPDTPGLSCVGNVCTPYTCSADTCDLSTNLNECKGNVCRPKDYTCTLKGATAGIPNCIYTSGAQVTCRDNSCYFIYDNPNKVSYYGCQSKEPPSGHGQSSSFGDGTDDVPKYCNNNEHCVGFYSDQNNWDTDTDPITCYENLGPGYHKFMYKQKVN